MEVCDVKIFFIVTQLQHIDVRGQNLAQRTSQELNDGGVAGVLPFQRHVLRQPWCTGLQQHTACALKNHSTVS